jgi:hypothetical protein
MFRDTARMFRLTAGLATPDRRMICCVRPQGDVVIDL